MKLSTHATKIKDDQMTWGKWKQSWLLSFTERELLNLLHCSYSAAHNSNHVCEWYRTLLRIADVSSGYDIAVREKAFTVLFGGSHLNPENGGYGVLPVVGQSSSTRQVPPKALTALLWFLRPETGKSDHHDSFRNLELIKKVKTSVSEKFYKGINKVLPALWMHGTAHVTADGRNLELANKRFRPTLMRTILCFGVGTVCLERFIRGYIKHMDLPHDTPASGKVVHMNDLDALNKRVSVFTESDLMLIKDQAEKCEPLVKPVFSIPSDRVNESQVFLEWFMHLKNKMLPTMRAKTAAAIAARH